MSSADSPKTYDFVVVGAGPAGCVIASRLAATPQKPTVLLLEAGGKNDNVNNRMIGHKTLQFLNPQMIWDYVAEPNPHQDGRAVPLQRGKGMGGGSAVNYTLWTEGAKADWDRMARLLGDDAWQWERVKERYNRLTTHHCKHPDVRAEDQAYVSQQEGNHGTCGPLHIGYTEEMEDEIRDTIDILSDCGFSFRPEANNGTMAGLYYSPNSFWRGTRSTAADLLDDHQDNLEIAVEALVSRVLFEGDRAVGVEAVDGRVFRAAREVILSAGSMDSPKILMHSGIGPEDQLSKFGIPIRRANANVGRDFQDHVFVPMSFHTDETLAARHTFFKDDKAKGAALRAWQRRRNGPYASIGAGFTVIFDRPEAIWASAEFAALPEDEREHLGKTDTPLCELGFNFLPFGYLLDPANTPATFQALVILQHLQSRGKFQLKSADPREPLAFHTGYLSHEFDRRNAVESTRFMMAILRRAEFRHRVGAAIAAPASESEEDIMQFWRQQAHTVFHATSTCKMGRREVEDAAVVDTEFRVHGVKGLRVADNSIMPHCPSGHTQTTAYQIGSVAAEKLIAEYELM